MSPQNRSIFVLPFFLGLAVACGESDAKDSGGAARPIDFCQHLCGEMYAASASEVECTAESLSAQGGYEFENVPACVEFADAVEQGTVTDEECNGCYEDAGVDQAHCEPVFSECF